MELIQVEDFSSPHLITLYKWFDREWEDVEKLSPSKHGKLIPKPIIALNNGELMGGLIFTRFLSPITQQYSIWINAVYIKSEYRMQGLSSSLIKHAEKKVKELGESELLVFAKIPELYSKLGWKIVEIEDDHFVLKSSLV